MSRAFTKEEAPDAPVILADRAVSEHPNYMTETGHRLMENKLRSLQLELGDHADDESVGAKNRLAELRRDIRYYTVRLKSADIIQPAGNEVIRFGHHVGFEDDTGEAYHFQIVGEDEADIKQCKLSWTAPLAQELVGKAVGDSAKWQKNDLVVEIEILSINLPNSAA